MDICDVSMNILQDQVEDICFVDKKYKLKGYICCSCKNVAILHRIADCGDTFCVKCYQNHHMKPCPECETIVETNEIDVDFASTVLELKVRCKHKSNGCQETILLKNYLNHIESCQFVPVNLLPAADKFDEIKKVLEKFTEDVVERVNEATKTIRDEMMQLENNRVMEIKRIEKVLEKIIDSLEKDRATQAATLQKMDRIQAEIVDIKNAMKEEETDDSSDGESITDVSNMMLVNLPPGWKK